MFEEILANVAAKTPLIHCITNYVTVNDVANMLLACGGSPIMADDDREAEEITSVCDGLALNLGTLNSRTVRSMLLAGRRANALGRPVVLDPVGAGASALRTETARELLREVRFAVLRGNGSEMKVLAGLAPAGSRGVDVAAGDAVTEATLDRAADAARELAARTGAIVAVTGAIDVVADERRAYLIRNGCPEMGRITGTGCMLTGVIAAWCAANPQAPLDATAAAVCAMGLCGELARARARESGGGTATMRVALIDAMSTLDAKTLNGGMRLEVR